MAVRRGPTLRAQILGQKLRELREEHQLTLKEVAEYLQRDASTISRFEVGILPARVPEVLAYLDLCSVDDPHCRDALRRLSQDVFQKGWWDGYTDEVAGSLIDRIWLESRALEIRSFEATVLPGLLQTRAYAGALMRAADPDAPTAKIDRWLEIRMTRQQLLTRPDPIRLTAIIDEGALRRRVGGNLVMRAQLDHLAELANRPNVEVMVLPAAAGAHACPDGSFEILHMCEPFDDVGYAGTPAGEIYVEAIGAERLATTYDRLRQAAIDGDMALAFIATVRKGMR